MFNNRIAEVNLLRASGLIDADILARAMGREAASPGVPLEFLYLENQRHWTAATSALFDGKYYLDRNPDLHGTGTNPLLHYVCHGYREGRSPTRLVEIDYLIEQLAPPELLDDEAGLREFSSALLAKYGGIRELLASTGRNPSRFFDNEFYRAANSEDASEIGLVPLEHYLRARGRSTAVPGRFLECTPLASMAFYMEANPDLRAAKVVPLAHLIQYGFTEGRRFSKDEKVSKEFLENSAHLFAKPAMSKLDGFLSETEGTGQIAGPYWPTRYTHRSIPSLAHQAGSNHRSAFIGIVLYENSDEEILRMEQSIRKQIEEAKGYRIDYAYLANDAHNEARYRRLLGGKVRIAPEGRNLGFGSGHNLLMRDAFGGHELYIGANPDGYFTPGCVKTLIDFSDYHAGHALIEALAFPIDHPKWHDPVTLDTCWVSGACFALPKALWREVHGFDEAIHMYCEDVDLSWRVRLLGGALKVCPTARFVHDVTPRFVQREESREAESSRRRAMLVGNYYLSRKWGGEEQVMRAKANLATELSAEEIAQLEAPEVVIDAEIAKRVADFAFDRFAPSRFWT